MKVVSADGLDSEFQNVQKEVVQCCANPSSFFSITTYCYLDTNLFFLLLVNYHCRSYFLPLVFERYRKGFIMANSFTLTYA